MTPQPGRLTRYIDLLTATGGRMIKVRYKQSYLGIVWAVLQPIATMVVFTFVFGRIAKMASDGLPYKLFSLAGLIPWTFFNTAVNQGAAVLVGSASLLRKAAFPREVLNLAVIGAALFDTLVAFVIFVGLAIWWGHPPGVHALLLIPVMLIAAVFALGVTLILAPANVYYRDVRHAVPLVLNLWLFATPVAYPLSEVPERLRFLYDLNPMVGVIEAFRDVTVHGRLPDFGLLGTSAAVSWAVFIVGLYVFKKVEGSLADII